MALRRRGPVLAGASLVAALGYVLAGGAGAAALAMGGPPLIDAYAGAGADQATIAVVFGTLVEIVFRAIWQLLGAVLLAVWMLGTAVLVRP